MLGDIFDYISEGFEYIISFDWFGDLTDALGSAFEGIGEFSFLGIAFGLLTGGLNWYLRKWLLYPFLQYYNPTWKIIMTIATIGASFIAGYFIGKFYENT